MLPGGLRRCPSPSGSSSPLYPEGSSAESRGSARDASSLPIGGERRGSGHVGPRPSSSSRHLGGKFGGRAAGGAERGEVPGVGRLGGERASGLAGPGECGGGGGRGDGRGFGGAAAEGSSSPVPSPPQLSSSSPGRGGGTWSAAGRGNCPELVPGAPRLRAYAARGNFVAAPQVWGPAEVCMWGAGASRRAAAAPSGPRWSSPEEASEEGERQARGRGPGRARGSACSWSSESFPSRCWLKG